jgi:putative lipoprotein
VRREDQKDRPEGATREVPVGLTRSGGRSSGWSHALEACKPSAKFSKRKASGGPALAAWPPPSQTQAAHPETPHVWQDAATVAAIQRMTVWSGGTADVIRRPVRGTCELVSIAVALAIAATTPRGVPAQARTLVYDCQNLATVTLRVYPDSVEVRAPGESAITLPLAGSNPVRYANETTTLSGLNESVRIDGPLGHLVCRSAPAEVPWAEARLRGIDFRAVGDAPDWTLDIDEGARVEFVANHGATRLVGVPAQSQTSAQRMTVTATSGGHALQVAIERRTCTNSAGTTTQATIVTLDGTTYAGCGRALLSGLLIGTIALSTPIALPTGSELHVQIVPAGGSPGQVLAETSLPIQGTGPFSFRVRYNPLRPFGGDRYVIRAAIDVKSRPRWATRSRPLVVTWGHVANVELTASLTR